MSDTIDNANDQAALILQWELQARLPSGPAATGFCLSCEAPLPPEIRWCDSDCLADYERVERAQQRNGRGDV